MKKKEDPKQVFAMSHMLKGLGYDGNNNTEDTLVDENRVEFGTQTDDIPYDHNKYKSQSDTDVDLEA